MLFGSCPLLFVSSTNSFQIVRRQCCLAILLLKTSVFLVLLNVRNKEVGFAICFRISLCPPGLLLFVFLINRPPKNKNRIQKEKYVSAWSALVFVFLINRQPKAAVSSKYLIAIKSDVAQEYCEYYAADYYLQCYLISGYTYWKQVVKVRFPKILF